MILNVKNLTVGYDSALISSVNFSLDIGQKLVLFGSNGCGKSTLLKSLLSTTTRLHGQVDWYVSPEHIVTISQDTYFHASTPDFVEDYLLKCCLLYQPFASKSKYQEKVRGLMQSLALPNLALKTLSGGQKQKLKLARVLLDDAKVLLLDEPLNAVDVKSRSEILQTLNKLSPTTLQIWILHDYYEIQQLQSPVLWIQEGVAQLYTFEEWFKKVDQAFHSWMKKPHSQAHEVPQWPTP